MKILFALALLFPLSSYAERAVCQIKGAKEESQFAAFVGGKILVDLSNGNTTLRQSDASGEIQRELITSEFVSTLQTPRAACHFATETIIRRDGSLRAMIFRFSDCSSREPLGYVRAEVEFDLTANFGAYREILLKPRGDSPSDFVRLADCTLEP